MQQHRARSEPRNAKWKVLKNAHQQSLVNKVCGIKARCLS